MCVTNYFENESLYYIHEHHLCIYNVVYEQIVFHIFSNVRDF